MTEQPPDVLLVGDPCDLQPLLEALKARSVTRVSGVADAVDVLTGRGFDVVFVADTTAGLDAGALAQLAAAADGRAVVLAASRADAWPTARDHGILVLTPKLTALDLTAELLRWACDRQRLQKRHRRSRRMQAVGHFARGMAHEFNNLLTGVIGYTELLKHGPVDQELVDLAVPEIMRAAQQMANLTQQLRNYERRRGRPTPVELGDFLRALEPDWRHILGPSIELRLELDSTIRPLCVDLSALEVVLEELVNNARNAMANGGVLTLRTALAAPPPDAFPESIHGPDASFTRIQVADTGHGMEPSVLARIFDPFFTTRGDEISAGMGLTVARTVIHHLNGHLTASSVPGRGSTFTVYLPTEQR